MEKVKFLLPLFLVLCVLQDLPGNSAICNVCQDNGAACNNLTTYYLCFGENEPNTTELFTCPSGHVCTDFQDICLQASKRPASCGDVSSCGICNSNQAFACTSRITFAYCFGATVPSDIVGTCPPNTICDATTQDICVTTNELTDSSIICDRDATGV